MRVEVEYGKSNSVVKEYVQSAHLYKVYRFDSSPHKVLVSADVIRYVAEKSEHWLVREPGWRRQVKCLRDFLEDVENYFEVITASPEDRVHNFTIYQDGVIELRGYMALLWHNKNDVIDYIDDLLKRTSIKQLRFEF
jgi:hypothetical protein